MRSWRPGWVTLAAVVVAAGLKVWLVYTGAVPFNADEAVVGLMARHIVGGARPVFFYGQAYMGSLDAFLIAAGFAVFGSQVWVIRLVQGLLYGGTLLTTVVLGREALGSWRVGVLAGWFLAVPAVNVTLYTTASLGNYGEALLLGNLILIGGLRIAKRLAGGRPVALWLWAGWGFLVGLGLWAFGLTLVYSLPVGFYLVWHLWRVGQEARRWRSRRWGVASVGVAGGVLLGAAPWWGFALANGVDRLLGELTGGAIAGVEGMAYWESPARHLFNLLVLGSTVIFGLRPPWEVRWLAFPLLPFALAFWLGVLLYIAGRLRAGRPHRREARLLTGVAVTLLAGFVLTPFGADPSGRYFLPLAVVLALFAADLVLTLEGQWGRWAWALPLLVLSFNLWGTLESASRNPPGLTTQFDPVAQVDHSQRGSLIEFLEARGETTGYSNYWVAYPLAFLSDEKLIYTPRLPYHLDFRYTPRDDRYLPYQERLAAAERVAYITTRHPPLDAYLRIRFARLGVSWKETTIGDYHLFYALSRVVRPEEIGLGQALTGKPYVP